MTSLLARRTRLGLGLAGLCTALGLLGCAAPSVHDYASERPVLDLRSYFNGPVTAHGMFSDRSGRVVKRFVVTMDCRWQGDMGTLDETFRYSDGSTQRRVWQLRRGADGRYVGTAADVVGEALGEAAGNAFHWRYTLALPVDGRVLNVQLDDWMFLVDEQVLLNKTAMSKFGLHLGDISLSFRKD
jgi:hypothetical protein